MHAAHYSKYAAYYSKSSFGRLKLSIDTKALFSKLLSRSNSVLRESKFLCEQNACGLRRQTLNGLSISPNIWTPLESGRLWD
jgi:hypothetical protein